MLQHGGPSSRKGHLERPPARQLSGQRGGTSPTDTQTRPQLCQSQQLASGAVSLVCPLPEGNTGGEHHHSSTLWHPQTPQELHPKQQENPMSSRARATRKIPALLFLGTGCKSTVKTRPTGRKPLLTAVKRNNRGSGVFTLPFWLDNCFYKFISISSLLPSSLKLIQIPWRTPF